MRIQEFDYELPEEYIAQEPLAERDQSRLLILDKANGNIEHRRFLDIVEYLKQDDLLVLNDTRVVATRLRGNKHTGAAVEALLLKQVGDNRWQAMVKPGRRVPVGTEVVFGDGELTAVAVERLDDGGRILEFFCEGDCDDAIARLGEVPLPPYICKRLEDRERYQTVYAHEGGSAAAPTAGLHFTAQVFDALRSKGIDWTFITLHVGIGTFRPVRVENIYEHEMHAESVFIGEASVEKINSCKGRIICVGTTTARALESAAVAKGKVAPMCGETRLFITPGYDFKIVDALVTNYHMPRSTLLVLISAFAGRDLIMKAYHEALKEHYRFLSFGDAMFIK
ncbi:MAG TPA: tRNA preQ1(34) S-adenosylmethionine ribosyltransferase-isomerase QueA [Armatimonadota bacterium]|nr:tRNA preQ1(34) S-adenosylmethionine ribosyltransferase-isomerase QueA [Armatimonadota bacterium]HOM71957.1 tRNA preQ1(34) S-adenosylmethionine ribosyltransferase-isomerase QueA [Armatimonadota bacterium]HOP80995.1 tRNA preQ1(34) S-adenosylmethionine ribosyltransferase-isomerase QueA [Armatimonadota bacterium]HPP73576.1 tRNA preQ1(34) S-adenosylmethionine ribosyltransferase-isomerase QueA [Armatimonadota bacterium]